ncbi:MAG: tRNA (uridine(34)/cytosine(34)/5-carboxymethylaminomethyluridine(34)-2'-O)-methyltransferase TrmL [Bacillota bacterium]|nr:tRNA (uridine(34)/cytosine(34)/5-carboxymethylaminomethyluridine(34)-2'-O)-methyltransferase TrmL [Bacillota bacterium]
MFNIVLHEPEIPQNTGNIARTCSVTGARLHIIKPMGFEVNDKYLKRAGLDYWHLLDITYYENMQDFIEKNHDKGTMYFCTTKSPHNYCDVQFKDGDYLIFGKETKGLPEDLLRAHLDTCIRIPMRSETRSLNLSNSVAIIIYEALRQNSFINLQTESEYLSE